MPVPGAPINGSSLGLGLVDFDVFLQGMNQLFLKVLRGNRFISDLAQGDYRVLVVVPLNGDLASRGDQARPMARQQDEIEAVFDFVDAILDGNAGHKSCSSGASMMRRAGGSHESVLGIGSLTWRRYRHRPASARGNGA